MASTAEPPIQSRYPHLRTARPAGTNLNAGQIDWQRVSAKLLGGLEALAKASGRVITIFSGYRTSSYSAAHGGFAGDPHTQGRAVDATVAGRPIGTVFTNQQFAQYGIVSGNQPNFYKGQPDRAHIQLGGSGTTTKATTMKDYIDAVLRGIGAPITMTSELFLAAWTQKEGTKAQFNPLATTLKEPGSSNFNPIGVQNYPTPSVGERATANTLLHGYPNIVQLLRHGVPTLDVVKPGVVSDLQLWGTGKRSGNAYAADVVGIYQKGTGQGAGNILGRPLTAAGDKAVSAVSGWLGDLIHWIEGWAKRGLFVVGGFLLILLGIVMIGRQAASGTLKAAAT